MAGVTDPDWNEAVIVALGSNLPGDYGGSDALLEAALDRFPDHGLRVKARSGWWRSAAWPDPTAPAFLNGVAFVETALDPRAVLGALLRLEQAFGRQRAATNAPRTLDLDLIAYGRRVLDEPGLIVPHPRAARRLFVMGPLAEVAPGWLHPVERQSAAALAVAAADGRDAQPVATGASSRAPHSAQEPS